MGEDRLSGQRVGEDSRRWRRPPALAVCAAGSGCSCGARSLLTPGSPVCPQGPEMREGMGAGVRVSLV